MRELLAENIDIQDQRKHNRWKTMAANYKRRWNLVPMIARVRATELFNEKVKAGEYEGQATPATPIRNRNAKD